MTCERHGPRYFPFSPNARPLARLGCLSVICRHGSRFRYAEKALQASPLLAQ